MSTLQETSENLLSFCGDKRYSTIYADPPWRFQNRTGKVAPENKKLNRYETMPLEDIMALPVEQVAAAKSHLLPELLPTVHNFLQKRITSYKELFPAAPFCGVANTA